MLFCPASIWLVENQSLASTLRNLFCIELHQNSKYCATHDYIKKKENENLSNKHISEAGLFSQSFSDDALVIYFSSTSRKIAVEEKTAVMANHLKWASFTYIHSLAGVSKLILNYLHFFYFVVPCKFCFERKSTDKLNKI